MRRPYTVARFGRVVAQARAAIPGVAITTDVIAGHPGETDDEFERSLEFVESVGFARIHVFSYSERSGTRAASLPDPVPIEVRRERTARLLRAAESAERGFRLAQLGHEAQVLWEDRAVGCRRGTTDNYLRVRGRGDGALWVGDFERVRFCRLADGEIGAEPLDAAATPRPSVPHQARMLSPAST
jgi:threonylcarbamoyladenosine tRNA methylthiotransferase MtaB